MQHFALDEIIDMEFINNLPTCEQLDSAFGEFNKIDWTKAETYDDITKIIPSILKTRPTVSSSLEGDKIEFLRLSCPFKEDEPFDTENISSVSKFSYPPVKYCKEYGRANIPGKPVFYASINSLRGSIDEYRLMYDKKKYVFLGIWKMKPKTRIQIELFLLLASKDSNGKEVIDTIRKQVENPIELMENKEKKDVLNKLNDFYLKNFTKVVLSENKNDYKYTSYFGHDTLYLSENKTQPQIIDALAYPSTRNNYETINIAIHPNFVNENMYLKEIFFLENIKNIPFKDCVGFKIIEKGTVLENNIHWTKPTSDEEISLFEKIKKLC